MTANARSRSTYTVVLACACPPRPATLADIGST